MEDYQLDQDFVDNFDEENLIDDYQFIKPDASSDLFFYGGLLQIFAAIAYLIIYFCKPKKVSPDVIRDRRI